MRQQFRSSAVKAANNLFRQGPEKVVSDYEKAHRAFHANRERLKAERLARELEQRSRRDGTC